MQSSMFDDGLQLAQQLLEAESEKQVVKILKKGGYWDDVRSWKDFDGHENNYSIIGNQQANPVAALVEKLVNSVDAVLMRECLRHGIDPEAKEAPGSIAEALESFFGIKAGNLANIGASKRTALAANIGLVASGQKRRPNYVVFDRGEGQTPEMMPKTFLSLAKSNKLRIPFVQGKFNMGGSGVLRFCGDKHLNLLISRRHPEIANAADVTATKWGFTIIRREDPSGGRKNSVYTYLAPKGKILTFDASQVEVPEFGRGTQKIEPISWGTVIKLYEYEIPGGMKTNILFDLYNEISMLLPRAGLPIRFYERRNYSGHSLESTLAGLNVRLEEDKRDNVELGFPTNFEFHASGEQFAGTIYAFRKDSSTKYKKSEGILFTSNGQSHGHIPQSFFTRKRVGMSYLADSLLVIVECDRISHRSREVLFMNSRDRLSEGDLRREIETCLEEILSKHPGLRELRERRRREAVDARLQDSKPLKDVLNEILAKSPALSALFTQGADISNPFKSRQVDEGEHFEGKPHPTFFALRARHREKDCHLNLRFRLQFDTDVENDYFGRDRYPGRFSLHLNGEKSTNYVLNLWNGTATVTVPLLPGAETGDTVHGEAIVEDETLIEPFRNPFTIHVIGEKAPGGGGGNGKGPAGKDNGDQNVPDALQLPLVTEVREDRWAEFGFDKFSALSVVFTGAEGYDFYINMDNVFLRTELKHTDHQEDAKLLDARFKYALVLLGMGILKDREVFEESDNQNGHLSTEDMVAEVSRSVAPMILPMIEALGRLELSDIATDGHFELEYEK